MNKYGLLACLLLMLHIAAWGQNGRNEKRKKTECKMVKIKAVRLPDLNIPRSAHALFCVNGEITVVGGHTESFVPTPTAEYFKDGAWHLVSTKYNHDNGLSVVLQSGKVLLGGGHAEPLGIGRSFPVELYDPATHTFCGFSCFDQKRTLAMGTELDSGKVAVAGNWYADDQVEMFDGIKTFVPANNVTIGRASPYVLRIADDDALIFGNLDERGNFVFNNTIDRVKGRPFRTPLFLRWQPLIMFAPYSNDYGFIGDASKGDYAHIIAVQDYGDGRKDTVDRFRQIAFATVRDTTFTLLETVAPIPMRGKNGPILYIGPAIADRKTHRAFVRGFDRDRRQYVLAIDYALHPSPITLFYTDPLPDAGIPMTAITDEGDLVIVGGYQSGFPFEGVQERDNFAPFASAYLLPVGFKKEGGGSIVPLWAWIVGILFLLCLGFFLWLRLHRKPESKVEEDHLDEQDQPAEKDYNALMGSITHLMEDEKYYLKSELKLKDVAEAIGVDRHLVSDCIHSERDSTFNQYVNSYRVAHAQRVMRAHPDKIIMEIALGAGFTNDVSFFRAFKNATGMTPREWLEKMAETD